MQISEKLKPSRVLELKAQPPLIIISIILSLLLGQHSRTEGIKSSSGFLVS